MTRRNRHRAQSKPKSDPDLYSPQTSTDRIRSFAYAVSGCTYMLRHQKNTRIILVSSVFIVSVAMWLDLEAIHWAMLILAIGGVWVAEFINAAIEATVNLLESDMHPMAKVAKDVAAAAVLITVFVAVLIGLLILGPAVVDRLNANATTS